MHATSDLDPLHAIPPVPDETTIYHLIVRGQLPPTLAGAHLTLGPNPIGGWSTGRTDPMVHRVDIRGGRALAYRNRWVLTDATADMLGVDRVPGPRPAPDELTHLDVIAGTILTTGIGGTGFELAPDLTTIRTVDVTGHRVARTSTRRAQQSRTHLARAADALDPGARWLIVTTHLDAATELTIWDAGDVFTAPLATISIPRPIPLSTHTTWVPALTTHAKGTSK